MPKLKRENPTNPNVMESVILPFTYEEEIQNTHTEVLNTLKRDVNQNFAAIEVDKQSTSAKTKRIGLALDRMVIALAGLQELVIGGTLLFNDGDEELAARYAV